MTGHISADKDWRTRVTQSRKTVSTAGEPQKKRGFAVNAQYSFRCPLCDRRFIDNIARGRHLIDSTTCNAVEAILRLQFLLADRDQTVAAVRRQRDEAREAMRI
jgi:hypothetical protein